MHSKMDKRELQIMHCSLEVFKFKKVRQINSTMVYYFALSAVTCERLNLISKTIKIG
jgi:hypothetical protein